MIQISRSWLFNLNIENPIASCYPIIYSFLYLLLQPMYCSMKRDSTLGGTIRGIRILPLVKIPTFIMIGWGLWIRKRVNYLSGIEGKGVERHSLYFTKCRAICFSIIKSLLLNVLVQISRIQSQASVIIINTSLLSLFRLWLFSVSLHFPFWRPSSYLLFTFCGFATVKGNSEKYR